jgi:hypothetical protein
MLNNLTPEETTALTNEDTEEIRDDEHPKGSLDEDTEGSGVDEPELDSAGWDDEIEPEDREDFSAAKIKFDELHDEDRELYLEFVSLRQELKEGSAEKEGKTDLKGLLQNCRARKEDAQDGPRIAFLNLMIKKAGEL